MSLESKTIIIAEVVILALVIVVLVFTYSTKKARDVRRIVEAPTPYITPPDDGLLVVRSAPVDIGTVPLDQVIVIEFNRVPREGEYALSLFPDTPYTSTQKETTLSIVPKTQWQEGMTYRYTVRYTDSKRSSQGFTFTTRGEIPDELPDTRPEPTYVAGTDEYQRMYHPDTYVVNKLPYKNDLFTITAEDTRGAESHAYFIITPKNNASQSEVKEAVEAWLLSLQLTPEQIEELDIQY